MAQKCPVNALASLRRIKNLPWYPTALEIVFRLIHGGNLEPWKIKIHRDREEENRFSLSIPRSAYHEEATREITRDVRTIHRVALKMQAEGWLEILPAYRPTASLNPPPLFYFLALRLYRVNSPSRIRHVARHKEMNFSPRHGKR